MSNYKYELINFDNFKEDRSDIKMFFGEYDGIQRYDTYKYEIFKKLYDVQEASRWRPQEINFSKDKANMPNLQEGHQEIYRNNLLYQTSADSLANRFLEDILCQCVTSPELEAVIKTQGNFELLHSFSYSYNIRQVYVDPKAFFNQGFKNKTIRERLIIEGDAYKKLHEVLLSDVDLEEKKKVLLEAIVHQYALENIRFFISFLYTYMLNEVNNQKLQGSCNNLTLILNDEVIHTTIFKHIIDILGDKEDEGFTHLVNTEWFTNLVNEVFRKVYESEMDWFRYLDSIDNINGLNETTVSNFLLYYIGNSLRRIKVDSEFDEVEANDLVNFFETKKNINNQKAAAQETNLLSYNIGVLVDGGYDDTDYSDITQLIPQELETKNGD